ncbi:MAG: hypothetical protein H6738_01220 [Alphaproteobacteria bacterium]|nr:hypothetical protein [Alphaproteobacteria bacterium]MCB9695388.1 hypothetical protein [Alphaproteobacteria bacterium]
MLLAWLACGSTTGWLEPLPEPVGCPLPVDARTSLPAEVPVRLQVADGLDHERALAITRGAASAWAACGTRLRLVASERTSPEPPLGGVGASLEGADEDELARAVLAPLGDRLEALRPPREEVVLVLLPRVVGERSPLRMVAEVRGLGLSPTLVEGAPLDALLRRSGVLRAPFTPVAFVAVDDGGDALVAFHELAHALGLGHAEQGGADGVEGR